MWVCTYLCTTASMAGVKLFLIATTLLIGGKCSLNSSMVCLSSYGLYTFPPFQQQQLRKIHGHHWSQLAVQCLS